MSKQMPLEAFVAGSSRQQFIDLFLVLGLFPVAARGVFPRVSTFSPGSVSVTRVHILVFRDATKRFKAFRQSGLSQRPLACRKSMA